MRVRLWRVLRTQNMPKRMSEHSDMAFTIEDLEVESSFLGLVVVGCWFMVLDLV